MEHFFPDYMTYFLARLIFLLSLSYKICVESLSSLLISLKFP